MAPNEDEIDERIQADEEPVNEYYDGLSLDERRKLKKLLRKLNDDEIEHFGKMLEDDKRTRWLWASFYRLVIAMGAVAAALTALKIFLWDHVALLWRLH